MGHLKEVLGTDAFLAAMAAARRSVRGVRAERKRKMAITVSRMSPT